MPPDALAADSGPLSIDQAVTALSAEPEKEKPAPVETEQAQPPETPNSEAEPTAEDAPEPETAIEGEQPEAEEPEAEQPAAIEPPKFWDAEAKKRFSELPRDVQEIVSKNEQMGIAATAKSLERAALASKAAEAQASKLATLTGELDKLIPQAKTTFQSKWGNGDIDWTKVAEQHGVEQAFTLKNQFEQDVKTVQQLDAAKVAVEQQETHQFKLARDEQFKTLVPEFVDPKEGPKRQMEVVSYLASQGIPQDIIVNRASAQELLIARKAMLWDQANAQAKAKASAPAAPKNPAAQQQRPSVRPTAAPAQRNSQSARLQTLSRKPSLTIDEAVELANLKDTGT